MKCSLFLFMACFTCLCICTSMEYGVNYLLQQHSFEKMKENQAIFIFKESNTENVNINNSNLADFVQVLKKYDYPYLDEEANFTKLENTPIGKRHYYERISKLLNVKIDVFRFNYVDDGRVGDETFSLQNIYSVGEDNNNNSKKSNNTVQLLLAKTHDHTYKFFPLLSKSFQLTNYAKLLRYLSIFAPVEENVSHFLKQMNLPDNLIKLIIDSKMIDALKYFNTDNVIKSLIYIIEKINAPGLEECIEKEYDNNADINRIRDKYRERWQKVSTTIIHGLQEFEFLFKRYVTNFHISKYEWNLLGKKLQAIISAIGGFFPKMVQVIAQNDMVITNPDIRKHLLKFLDENPTAISDEVLMQKFHANFGNGFKVQDTDYRSGDCRLCNQQSDEQCVTQAGSIGQVNEIICSTADSVENEALRLVVKTLHDNVIEKYTFDYYILSTLLRIMKEHPFLKKVQEKLKSETLNELQIVITLLPSIEFAYAEVKLEFELEKEAANTREGWNIIDDANKYFQSENFIVKGSVPYFCQASDSGTMLLQSKVDHAEGLSTFLKKVKEDVDGYNVHKKNMAAIMSNLLSYFGYMIFEKYKFHGDLHGGNIMIKFIIDENSNEISYKLIFIDWGTVISIFGESINEQKKYQVLMNLLSLPALMIDKNKATDIQQVMNTFTGSLSPTLKPHPDIQKATLLGFSTGIFKRYTEKIGSLAVDLGYQIDMKSAVSAANFLYGLFGLSLSFDLAQLCDVQEVKHLMNKKLLDIDNIHPPTFFIGLQKNYLHLLGLITDNELKDEIRSYSAWRYFLAKKEKSETMKALCDIVLNEESLTTEGLRQCEQQIASVLGEEWDLNYEKSPININQTSDDVIDQILKFITTYNDLITKDVGSLSETIVIQ